MKLIDCFRTDEPVIDRWTFVFDDQDPWWGYYTMLSTDDTGEGFSQWTEGYYEPSNDNSHLGVRPEYIGEVLVDHVLEQRLYPPDAQ